VSLWAAQQAWEYHLEGWFVFVCWGHFAMRLDSPATVVFKVLQRHGQRARHEQQLWDAASVLGCSRACVCVR
jgi:hypothetical protein